MTAQIIATVENGSLKLDEALPFPDQTRVKITVEPVWDAAESLAAWERIKARSIEHPIAGLAGKFSRDELYERD